MKKLIYSLVLPCLLLSSCSDWLNVGPSNQTSREDLFKQGQGYQIALNGIYQELSTAQLYGRELSWGMLSAMGQDYNADPKSNLKEMYKDAAKYDYKNLRLDPVIDDVWSTMYNAVANCNSLIDAIQKNSKPEMFQFRELERNVILGEAYALRAMIHLDLMRLFAPAPVVADGAKKYLPYVTEFPTPIGIPITQKEYFDKMMVDFKLGKDLTATMDTLPEYRTFAYNTNVFSRLEGVGGASDFFKFRSTRLNYYAITSMMARAYLYAGNKPKAYEQAKEIYDIIQGDYTFKSCHKFTPSSELNKADINLRNLKSYWDIMFALYNIDEATIILTDYYENFNLPLRDVDGWFTGVASDYRKLYLTYSIEGEGYYSVKVFRSNNADVARTKSPLLPIFRMAELYYILAETAYDTDIALAKACFAMIKTGRNTGQTVDISTPELLKKAIIDDATREWICEGQTFFLLKRLNVTDGFVPAGAKLDYVLPIPASNSVSQ